MKLSTRRGSALLIVLGLLSFIVVSAVAFATYMRYARLPSSYLRRTSASRMLVKAALAEAIENIDAAIGDNPYPGVGTAMVSLPRNDEGNGNARNYNYWRDRVFLGWDPGDTDGGAVSKEDTISVLNVEALAYVPPPFINDLRYWSRYSSAGKWHTMAFDAGRFAFAALDVSDCFDVNKIAANAARDSSDLGRISLAHCFENANHDGDYVIDPAAWDNFMKNFIDPSGTKVPLVSVADLNLALADRATGDLKKPPFIDHLNNGAKFVPEDQEGNTSELVKNMCFITESYSAASNSVDALDISLAECQPLDGLIAGNGSSDKENANEDTIEKILSSKSDFVMDLADYLSPFAVLQLYDYLDRDSVPISLALPTVERTPMLTGVAVVAPNLAVTIDDPTIKEVPDATKDPTTGNPSGYTRITTTKLSLKGQILATVGLVYPFKYDHGKNPKFKVQAAATIALIDDTPADRNNLRLGNAKKPAIFEKATDWASSKKVEAKKFANEKTPSVVQLFSAPVEIQLPKKIEKEEDAVITDIPLNFDQINVDFTAEFAPVLAQGYNGTGGENGTFRLVERLDGNKQVVSTLFEIETQNFRPVKMDLSGLDDMKEGSSYAPVVQVWVRILDENNKVVDLVPASVDDDEKPSALIRQVAAGSGPRGALRFYGVTEGEGALTVNQNTLFAKKSVAMKFTPALYMTDDPRFNYAPENWIMGTEATETFAQRWLKECTAHDDDRDGDIFMTTSDAGYLQSAYELAYLSDLTGTGKFVSQASYSSLSKGFDGRIRTGFQGCPSRVAAWRTCSSKEARQQIRDEFEVTSGTKGFRINPNTRDINIMMSALANTPQDWWAASTNNINDSVKKGMLEKSKLDSKRLVLNLDKALDYTFDFNHGKMKNGVAEEKSLLKLAEEFMRVFADAGKNNQTWDVAFDNLNWDEEDRIAGIDLDTPLHAVDRTFLHGFWRECFDNRQQLFLVFVRAEPMMMGGGGLGQTPPQLGGRAVALVWRDPKKPTPKAGSGTTNNPVPHRTRVLFYRQLD